MATTTSRRFQITAGPCKFELMLAVFDHQPVEFGLDPQDRKVAAPAKVAIRVTGCEWEGGSGKHHWCVKGFVVKTNKTFAGYYRSDRRAGFLDIQTA